MGNYHIDRIKSITSHCRDGNGEEFVMMCCENEMDDSSEELDIFLKQFLKE